MRDDRRHVAEFLWYACGLIPLAGVCLFWVSMGDQPVVAQRVVLFIVGAAIGGCALLAAGEWWRPTVAAAQAQTPGGPPVTNNGPSINTWNQSGGQNTINIGPQKLTFNQGIADEVLSRIPPGKPIMMQSVGSNADQAVADEYQRFLQGKGFVVQRARIGMMAPPPDHKITLGDPSQAQMIIIIAPSAN